MRTLRPLLFALAVLLMQQLGMVHRYAHTPAIAVGASSWQVDGGSSLDQTSHALGAIGGSQLPAHDASLCGLFDHLCIGDAVALAWLDLAVALMAAGAFVLAGYRVFTVSCFGFQARAPPVLSFIR